jgi:hypothetical protein
MRQLIQASILLLLLSTAAAQRRGVGPPVTRPTLPLPPVTPTQPIFHPPPERARPPESGWRPAKDLDQPPVVGIPYAAPYPVYTNVAGTLDQGDDQQQEADRSAPPPPLSPPMAPLEDHSSICAPNLPSGPTVSRMVSADYPPPFYIALKDGLVFLAGSYWVENDTLHYRTPDGEQDQVSLRLIDRAFSIRLNVKRAAEFHLP